MLRHSLLVTVVLLAAAAGCRRSTPAPAATTAAESGVVAAPVVGAQIVGSDRNDWVGYSLSSAGDVNGDGKGDLLVTAKAVDIGGRATIYFGPVSGTLTPAAANVTFLGEYAHANLGDGTLHAGGCDINGDKIADVLLGSPVADAVTIAGSPRESGDNRGKAYVFYGKKDLAGTINAKDADVQFVGEADFDAAGSTTACLGDLDRDGFDDIAISARRSSRGAMHAGAVYLIYGKKDLPRSLGLDKADAVLVGETAYDEAGVAVAAVGDITGDGQSDFLIGAPLSDAGGAESGGVYIVRGRPARFAGDVKLASETRVGGTEAGLRLGWSLDRAGDVNGDGVNDVVLGSSTLPSQATAAGAAFLLTGGADLQGTIDLAKRGTRLDGDRPADVAGTGVAGIGDVNGDGLADLVVGAPFVPQDEGMSGTGRIYLILGRRNLPSTMTLAEAAWTASGEQPDGFFGESIVGLADIDGDALPDFAVAARGAANEGIESGGVVSIFRTQRHSAAVEVP